MSRHEKPLAQILGGRADANVGFEALCALLRHLGFEERTRSSHHVFRRAGVEDLIDLQRDGDEATAYRVRQIRAVLTTCGLTTTESPEVAVISSWARAGLGRRGRGWLQHSGW